MQPSEEFIQYHLPCIVCSNPFMRRVDEFRFSQGGKVICYIFSLN